MIKPKSNTLTGGENERRKEKRRRGEKKTKKKKKKKRGIRTEGKKLLSDMSSVQNLLEPHTSRKMKEGKENDGRPKKDARAEK